MLKRFLTAASLEEPERAEDGWSRDEMSGRLVELSGMGAVASLTGAIGLVHDAQAQGEPVAWITLYASTFYPPDVADSGVDLESLAVVRAPGVLDAARAAERLVRSGAFGLVVMDLGRAAEIPIGLQGRLVSLAQKHDSAIVCLTEKTADTSSLGSMVSLRAEMVRNNEGDARFSCKVKVIKDKRRGPNWTHTEVVSGPAGLR